MTISTDDALAWLAAERRGMEELVRALVAQGSFTQDRAGVTAVVDLLEGALRTLAPARGGAAPFSFERVQSERYGPHLLVRGRAAGAPVVLVGHSDTVFPPGTYDGFRREGDRGHGPGAFDMKGGLVVAWYGLAAAARAGILDRLPVLAAIVSDEEVGSPESQPILRERVRGTACALVFESGRPGDLVVTRRRGVAALRVDARGVAAHAGNDPERGRSAIWSLARFVDRVQGLTEPSRGRYANVGTISGGTSKNTVPEHARCELDLRFETPEEGRDLVAAVEAIAREAALPGTTLAVARGGARAPVVRTGASAALAAEYGACQRACGLGDGEAPLQGGGSDACVTSEVGVPTIDGLGPRGDAYHTRGEWVDLASLVPKAQALLRFLAGR